MAVIFQKNLSKNIATYKPSLPGWRPEMGKSRKRTELQVSFSVDIVNMADKSNIRNLFAHISELRDAKLVVDVEIDIHLLPEEYFLVKFFREHKGNYRYFNVPQEKVSFYKCDQLDGLKYLIDEVYHSYKNKKIKT